MELAGHNRL